MIIQPTRRSFITGITSLLAAPAVVRAESLMAIKVIPFEPYMLLRGPHLITGEPHEVRLYESASDPSSFVGHDFFMRYSTAHLEFSGNPSQVGIAWSRDDEKAMRMIEPARPEAFVLRRSAPEPYAIDDPRGHINPTDYAICKHEGWI